MGGTGGGGGGDGAGSGGGVADTGRSSCNNLFIYYIIKEIYSNY